ncbi:MAG: trigger factor [Calditerrivibrio sp.]|nr:trigger factor [Calditerrivibrio sp.]
MKFNVSDAENSQKLLEIELPYEQYTKEFEKQLNKILPSVKLPGFRVGKAPKEMVRKEFKHKLSVQALEETINSAISKAIKESGVVPLNIPVVKDVVFEDDKPITFKVFVDVYPAVEVKNYKGFEFERELRVVSDEDVDEVLESLRHQHAVFEVADDGYEVKNGDRVVIDFVGKIDGEEFEGGKASNYTLDIGSKKFIEGFEEGIIGMKKGETKDIKVVFPKDYSENLAGKEAVFTVTVHEIKLKKLPELNDEFATTVDPNIENLEKLKESIKKEIVDETELINKEQFYDKLIQKLVEENPFDLPQSMIDEQSRNLADRAIKNYCRMYGLDPKKVDIDPDKIKDNYRDQAILQTKGAILLNAIADKENIVVTDEDVDAKIKEYAETLKMSFNDYKDLVIKNGTINTIKNNVLVDKIYDFLCSVNNVKDTYVTLKEVREREKVS